MTSLEIDILKSFKNDTTEWHIIDAVMVWEAAMRLENQGLLENTGVRFRLTEEGKELFEKIQRGEQ
jgi:predicted transcriptional regulator